MLRLFEMEQLFIAWPEIMRIYDDLLSELAAAQLNNSTGSDDDYIYGMSIGNKALDTMPPTGKISDITGSIAANYIGTMRQDKKIVRRELKNEAVEILTILDKLNISFRKLPQMQRQILVMFHWENKPWQEIINTMNSQGYRLTKEIAKSMRRKALDALTQLTGISESEYKFIMKIATKEDALNSIT